MILSDRQIIQLCQKGLIVPFEIELVNPASIDIRLGNLIKVENESSARKKFMNVDISQCDPGDPFLVQPEQFLLAESYERFYLPDDIAGEFKLCSTPAREGFNHALAAWLDPGWSGSVLTLELKNNCQHHTIPIYPGLVIGQIIFYKCDEPPTQPYKGRYNGDQKVTMSKGLKYRPINNSSA